MLSQEGRGMVGLFYIANENIKWHTVQMESGDA